MKQNHAFPPIEVIEPPLQMRAAAEAYGREAAACENIARACEELGIGADTFDAEAQRLRARQADVMAFLKVTS
jgi:hypothetical protein